MRVKFDPDLIVPSGRYAGRRLGDLTVGQCIKLQTEIDDREHKWWKLAQRAKLTRMRRHLHLIRDVMDEEADRVRAAGAGGSN